MCSGYARSTELDGRSVRMDGACPTVQFRDRCVPEHIRFASIGPICGNRFARLATVACSRSEFWKRGTASSRKCHSIDSCAASLS